MKTTNYSAAPFLSAAFVVIGLILASTPAKAQCPVDLANSDTGVIVGAPGGPARFDFMTQQPTGTGVIKPFLRVQAFPQEEGYNTSGGTPFDDKAGPWTHDITMADLMQSTEGAFFKLLLDVNEPNGRKSRVTLDQLQFYTSPVCSQAHENVAALGTLRWSFKPGDCVLLNAARNHGSGSGDMYAFIPIDAFAGAAPTDCVYMYVHFGDGVDADLNSAGGFEEWALVISPQATPTPTPSATPTPTPTPSPSPTPMRPSVCEAVAAQSDQCYQYFPTPCWAGHALWLPGADVHVQPVPCDPAFGVAAGSDGFEYIFSPPGTFTENVDNTASLTGHVESTLRANYGWNVNISFTGFTSNSACQSTALLELEPSCYAPTGPVDPATWHFYTNSSGTLTGTGNYAGAVLQFQSIMGCFQIGDGASGKNINYGMSGWYSWTVVSQPTNPAFMLRSSAEAGQHGDFNLNCEGLRPAGNQATTPSPTPTPSPKPRGKK